MPADMTEAYVVVITPFGVLLLVYKADTRRGLENCNSMTKRCNNSLLAVAVCILSDTGTNHSA